MVPGRDQSPLRIPHLSRSQVPIAAAFWQQSSDQSASEMGLREGAVRFTNGSAKPTPGMVVQRSFWRSPRSLCVVLTLGVLCLAAACSSTPSTSGGASGNATTTSTVAKMTAQKLADKLAPLGCAATTEDTSTAMGIKPAHALKCTISGEEVSIQEYRSAQQVEVNMNFAKGLGCAMAKGFGINEVHIVTADNWTVAPQTLNTAQAIQKAIGEGNIENIHC